jgi:hypothetical protein
VPLYGTTYATIYPSSNGYVTFLSGDSDTSESLEDHFAQPRISGLFDDLNPSDGGTISWKQLDDRVAVTWDGVREYLGVTLNTFQVVMYFDGRIELNYLTISAADGLVGLSAGEGLDPDFFATDFSATGACGPRPPFVQHVEVQTPLATPASITLTAVDDGLPDPPAALTYYVTSLPTGALRDGGDDHLIAGAELPYALSDGGNTVDYTPPVGFGGPDGFTFLANDGGVAPEGGDSDVGTVSIMVGGPQVVHAFYLDGDPGWDTEGAWAFGAPTGGGSHDGDPLAGHTGVNVYGYNLDGDYVDEMDQYFLTTTALDCADLVDVELRFWRWLGVETATYDHAHVAVSGDGVNWTTVWEHTGESVSDTAWQQMTLDISDVADNAETVYIRWAMGDTDISVTYPGWNIDDVEIWGVPEMSGCDSTATCPAADVNCDDFVDGFDIAVIRRPDNWLKLSSESADPRADVDGNGVIDGFDIAAVRSLLCWLR